MNSFLVIIDNGAMWSDHRHTAMLACPDRESAERACKMLFAWLKAKPVSEDDQDEINSADDEWSVWMNQIPFPLPEAVKDWTALEYRAGNVTFAVLEVPAWAKDKP